MKIVFFIYFVVSAVICLLSFIFKGVNFKLNINNDCIISEKYYKEALQDYKNESRIFYISLIGVIIFPWFLGW